MTGRFVLVVWLGAPWLVVSAGEIDDFPMCQDSCTSDCIPYPSYDERPSECDEFLWCAFVKTDFKLSDGSEAAICQRQKYFSGASLFRLQVLTVHSGTLDLSELSRGDELGRIELRFPVEDLNLTFLLTFLVVVTEIPEEGEVARADFDVRVHEVNQGTIDILGYDPTNESHSFGRLYEGSVFALGDGNGFYLSYELIPAPPDPNSSRAIEEEELVSHAINLRALFTWFDSESPAVFTLPPEGPVTARATIEQILDPLIYLQFEDTTSIDGGGTLDLEAATRFRRGDSSGDGRVDLSDVVYLLEHLFRGRATPGCPDAADADDDGVLSVTDALAIISSLFGAGDAPGFNLGVCAVDATADSLLECVSDC